MPPRYGRAVAGPGSTWPCPGGQVWHAGFKTGVTQALRSRFDESALSLTPIPSCNPATPRDSHAVQMAGAQLIVIENSCSLKAPRSSVTRTVKVNVPAKVGVPEMVFPPFGSSRPGGSAPATTDQS
jgi:hypothetical protein